MKSCLVLSSEDSSQGDSVLSQSYIQQQKIGKLREKQTRSREKYERLKSQYDDLLLKYQLLEEHNKLLEATRVTAPQLGPPPHSIAAAKVSKILEDFDSLLNVQSFEISKLMEDRDRLSAVCFHALNLLNRQDATITRFRRGFESLARYAQNRGESVEAFSHDFVSLGLDMSPILSGAHRPVDVDCLIEKLGLNRSTIDANEVLRSVSGLDSRALEVVTSFVMQQVSRQKQLTKAIEMEREKLRSLRSKWAAIVSLLKPSAPQKMGSRAVVFELTRLKKGVERLEATTALVRQLVTTFESFANRFPDIPDIERCLVRIRSWLQSDTSDVDVVQEVDFLLGLCLPAPLERGEHESSSTASSEIRPIAKERQPSQLDAEMIRQIRELKATVCQMKQQIRVSDDERRAFLSRHFKRSLPITTRWSEICEYLLSSR
jgi:hypothetical protein